MAVSWPSMPQKARLFSPAIDIFTPAADAGNACAQESVPYSMNRLLSVLVLIVSLSSARATHIIGGELYYDHLGDGLYTVTLKLYRNCDAVVDFDAQAAIGVFDGVNYSLLQVQLLSFPGATTVPVVLDSPCLTLPPNVCIETTSYTGTFTLPLTDNGYIITYQRCCRTGIIENLINPGDLGITVTTRIPGSTVPVNSSPRFNQLPPVALCLDQPLAFDHSASDPDGDSLVYSLATPLNGATAAAPQPNPPAPPPYDPVPWDVGYDENYQIDSDPAIAIDPVSGMLTLTPTLQGVFNVGVRVQEFRNGELLTETRRDFLFKVVACDASVVSAIQEQTEFCQSLNVQFVNNSVGATEFQWDFGDPNIDFDISTEQNPSWSYAAPGTYPVTLIANPGTTCADTIIVDYEVYLAPSPVFIPPAPFCGNEPVTLVATGDFNAGASIQWILGGSSVPPTSTDSVVTVQFAGPGTHEVTLTVAQNNCSGFYTDNVVNYGQPDASFTADPPSPQPLGTAVTFTDTSDPNGGVITAWDWTMSGNSFAESAPVANWDANEPGTYNVTLTVTTADGCSDIAEMEYEIPYQPIVIPNVFSPNGDGHNDVFEISNVQYTTNELTIYGRWGNKVYETLNYKNTWNGDGVPDGTYYYVLYLSDEEQYSGHLTILR